MENNFQKMLTNKKTGVNIQLQIWKLKTKIERRIGYEKIYRQ